MKETQKTGLQNLLGKAELVLQVGSEAADVLVHLGSGITAPGAVSVGLRVVNSIRKATQKSASKFFSEWRKLEDWGYAYTLYRACATANAIEKVDGVRADSVCIAKLGDITIGWEKYGNEADDIYGPYVQDGVDDDDVYNALGRAVWDSLGSCAVLIVDDDDHAQFQASEPMDELPSAQGDQLISRTREFLNQGIHRSILLVGRPGTGKSCMMRYIAAKAGGFILRVPTSEMSELSLRDIQGAVKILRPDTVLIDDFDRFCSRYEDEDGKISFALDAVEYIAKTAKILVVSANYSNRFPSALLRPGRFDEIEIVDEMDREILDAIIGDDVTKAIRKKLHAMPIAFVVEFVKRKDVMGAEKAFGELKSLEDRAEKVARGSKRYAKRRKKAAKKKKTPGQIAYLAQREAARLEVQAAKLLGQAERAREKASKARDKAAEKKKAKKR